MRAAVRLVFMLALAGAALLPGGCAMNKEDEGYYARGWLWPKDLDEPDRRKGAPSGRDLVDVDSGW